MFEVVFNDSNSHDAKITVGSNLKPTVTIPDNTNLSSFDIDAQSSNGLVLTARENASLGKLDGSKLYADTITVGDNFTATGDWNTTGGDDVITIGNGADFEGSNLKTGVGNDSVTFGDQALFGEIDTEGGNDTIRLGGGALAKRSLPVRAMILCTPARAKISIPLMAATGLTATQARKSVRTPRISKPKQLSVS